MHAGRNYTFREVALWTRRETAAFLLVATVPTAVYVLLDWHFLGVPWLPVAMLGTAVAFTTGFKNNASYDRTWEARKVWGAIVNTSRAWGLASLNFVTDLHAHEAVDRAALHGRRQRLIHRHIAWMGALRYQLRQPRVWETQGEAANREYRERFSVAEQETSLEAHMDSLMPMDDCGLLRSRSNLAVQILGQQSADLRELSALGLIDSYRHVHMQALLDDLLIQQGKCERIKNFPYPRQYATLNHIFVWLFILLVPCGMLTEFAELGRGWVWLNVPFSALVAWIFNTMDKIGTTSENPFEGGPNDTPITAIARTIEIDLRELLGEENVPGPLSPVNHILM